MKCILLGRRRRCGIGDLIRFTHYEPIHGGDGEGDKQQKAFAEGKAREQRDGDGDAWHGDRLSKGSPLAFHVGNEIISPNEFWDPCSSFIPTRWYAGSESVSASCRPTALQFWRTTMSCNSGRYAADFANPPFSMTKVAIPSAPSPLFKFVNNERSLCAHSQRIRFHYLKVCAH